MVHCVLFILFAVSAFANWVDFVNTAIDAFRLRSVPLRDAPWMPEADWCKKGQLWKFMGFLQFIVSDWLTIAPSQVPFIGGSAVGTWEDVEQAKFLATQGFMLSDSFNCVEAVLALNLFSTIVDNITSPMTMDLFSMPLLEGEGVESIQITWKQIAMSEWPILGLIAQKLRLEAQVHPEREAFLWASSTCERFVELVPEPPFNAEVLLSSAIRFLGDPIEVTPQCDLALSLALAILIQGVPRDKALSAVGVILSLAAPSSSGTVSTTATRSKIYYLLDQTMSCPGKLVVKSKGRQHFIMRIPAAREHVADRIRFWHSNHCGLEDYFDISLESEVASLLQSGRKELLVAEVGSGLGQCILPLLLVEPGRVRAISLEPVQHLRHLIAQSVEDNNVSGMVQLTPHALVPRDVPTGLVTLRYDVGHQTTDESAGELTTRSFSSKQVAKSTTLHGVFGSMHVDLLIIYPHSVCKSLALGLEDIKCERWLGNRFPYCVFVDCQFQSRSA